MLYSLSVCICSLRYPALNALGAMLSFVGCPALSHFAALCHKLHGFGKRAVESNFLCNDYVKHFLY